MSYNDTVILININNFAREQLIILRSFICMAFISVCRMFKGKIGKGFGTRCYVHDNCLGISCNVPFTLGTRKKTVEASVEFMPADLSINITFNRKSIIIKPNGRSVRNDHDVNVYRFVI